MLNQTGIKKVSAFTEKTILIAPELAFSMSCKVANTGLTADSTGKKIVKAGTPLAGNLEARNTAFTVAKDTTAESVTSSNATCMLLHDVDVTEGNANAQALIFGFVDTGKLDTDVVSKLTASARAALSKITFVK